MKPRRPRPSRYDTHAEHEKQQALAARIEKDLEDWEGPAAYTPDETGRHSKGGHISPTESAAINPDRATTELIANTHAFLDAEHHIEELILANKARRSRLEYLTLQQAKVAVTERTTPSTVGFCVGCDRHCDATEEYKSRIDGLCGACRKARQRWLDDGNRTTDPGADRRRFLEHRRNELSRRQAG